MQTADHIHNGVNNKICIWNSKVMYSPNYHKDEQENHKTLLILHNAAYERKGENLEFSKFHTDNGTCSFICPKLERKKITLKINRPGANIDNT